MSTIDSGHYGDGVARRTKRLWTDEEKRSICFQTMASGVSVAPVELRYAVNANPISMRFPFTVTRCTQKRLPLVSTRTYKPMLPPS